MAAQQSELGMMIMRLPRSM